MIAPLRTRSHGGRWEGPRLVKVAGPLEFSSGHFPVERMMLDVRRCTGKWTAGGALHTLPWGGYLGDEEDATPHHPSISLLDASGSIRHGDVLEIAPDGASVAVRYRRGDTGNVLFATERCNSYCLMCSQPPRQVDDAWRAAHLMEFVELVDRDEPEIAISGGEPTLLGPALAELVARCASTLPSTQVHILSNGRLLAVGGLAKAFEGIHHGLSWGIPLYGDTYTLHDFVVQSTGAFSETLRGLYALHQAKQRIEIRVVLVKPSVERLMELARYIYRNLPFVEHIALMGVEPIGFAKAHRDQLWIDPADAGDTLVRVIEWLAGRGLSVSLYNLPLCVLPPAVWPFARRSISTWKQSYLSACDECAVREQCGGFFRWTTPAWTSRAIRAIRPGGELCKSH